MLSFPLRLIAHLTCYLFSKRCSCGEGYALDADGRSCNDINECLLGTDDCDELASCTNTAGSWTCKCNDGMVYIIGCNSLLKVALVSLMLN